MKRSRRMIFWGAAAVIVAVFLFLIFRDPARVAWFPKCPVRLLTGWDCPGCGSSRALHALLHGRMGQALAFNPILVAAVPYMLVLGWLEYAAGKRRFPKLREAMTSRAACRVILAVLAGYTLARNLW